MTYSTNPHALALKAQLERQLQNTLPKSRLKAYALPACPALKLFLFDPAVMEGPITHEEAHQIVAAPAYWSFCWASGQVLAAHILKHPELVQHKTVLDFGCGSGVVAVASAMAGAAKVIACDLDSDALLAAQANAALNNVELELATDFLAERSVQLDLITAADVLYDADNLPLLSTFRSASPRVLLADSRIKTFPDPAYALMTTIEGRTYPDLNEFEEFNQVRIYQV